MATFGLDVKNGMSLCRACILFSSLFMGSLTIVGCSADTKSSLGGGDIYSLSLPSQAEIKAQMKKVADYQLSQPWPEDFLISHPLGFGDRSWRAGAYYIGIYEAYRTLGEQGYFDRLVQVGTKNNWYGGPRYNSADDQAIFQPYVALFEETHDDRMVVSVDSVLKAVVADTPVTGNPWSWSDALFMAPPVFAHYARLTEDSRYLDFLERHWWQSVDSLYDKQYHLFYRDTRFKTMQAANGKPIFWGRGNGWVMAGLSRVLQNLPEDYPSRDKYVALFREFSQGVLAAQHSDGFWKSSLLDPYSYIAGETSGTAFFCYGLAWGINHGILDKDTYMSAVVKAWRALVSVIHPNGKLGFVQGGGDRPHPTTYDQTEFYGVGGFLLAGSEVVKLAPKKKVELKDVPVEKTFEVVEAQMEQMTEKIQDRSRMPRSIRPDGSVIQSPIEDWTSGFFPGTLWYLYEYTQDEKWKEQARLWTAPLEPLRHFTGHHDVGFMVNCSFGNGYRLTQDTSYRQIIVDAAEALSTRFKPQVGLIQSWDAPLFKGSEYPVIIDNMMNLELLFNASKLSGNKKYYDIAVSHADRTMENHFRPDYSSFHVVDYDAEDGSIRRKCTAQGFADSSAWSRGQVWGLYGYTVCFRETGDRKYLDQACHIADFMLNHKNMPADKILYWDFDAPYIPNEPRDVSAAAIMTSALLELSKYVEKDDAERYYNVARTALMNLCSPNYLAIVGENGNFIQTQSCGSVPARSEVSVPLNYADYYFVEALLRYKNY